MDNSLFVTREVLIEKYYEFTLKCGNDEWNNCKGKHIVDFNSSLHSLKNCFESRTKTIITQEIKTKFKKFLKTQFEYFHNNYQHYYSVDVVAEMINFFMDEFYPLPPSYETDNGY
jgi:hypothetical protein